MSEVEAQTEPHAHEAVPLDDASLIAHAARLLYEREPLNADCDLCAELLRRLFPR